MRAERSREWRLCTTASQYIDERKAALQAWGSFVESLVHPERAQQNVMPLRRPA
jgi:hypothetical protein